MSAIQSRNRKDVHHGQKDAEECGDVPEVMPIPRSSENATNGEETTQAFVAFVRRREEQFQLFHVVHQGLSRFFNTLREAFEEAVFYLGQLEEFAQVAFRIHAQKPVFRNGNGNAFCFAFAEHIHDHFLSFVFL